MMFRFFLTFIVATQFYCLYSNAIEAPATTQKTQKLLLVTGCGRSGTGYMNAFLRASGLDVHHEYMGNDGSVSWLMGAIVDWAPWGPLSKDYQFKHVFHQVRNPVKVIQSFYNVEPLATWAWISSVIPQIKESDPLLTKSAKYWIGWNKLIEERRPDYRYRIEDFDKGYKEMAQRLGVEFDENILKSIGKKTNTKGPPKRIITWKILKDELDYNTYDQLVKMAKRYGYPTKD